ncbi:hypothetical protein GO988_14090 [Hymenobacter sp. HMF4947]|uniref:AMIN domain-containing protein n=1 Tax=Hymenobacter ginkgonis TaxID=2682976 RepID=A0A7K1TGL9_9BACT|nr:hypothetical protein [Hymenobacter ginkgonis]MVN77462.1 hypothetical protein [Hymenobacter ginkgonis]
MRRYLVTKLLLTAVGCLAGELARAQQPAMAPLAPRLVLVQPATPGLGVPVRTKWDTGGPPAAPALPTQPARVYRPVMLMNSHLILGDNDLRALNPQDIADIHVYKGADAPAKWRSLTPNGIIDIRLKTKAKFKSKTLAALKRQLGVGGAVRFELDGVPLEDTSLRIAAGAIDRVDLVRPAAGEAGITLLNIQVVRLPPPPHPPGTIRIRG